MKDKKIKLHLGSGGHLLSGWHNLDRRFDKIKAPNPETYMEIWQAPELLSFGNETVSFIYTEHFIEHIDEIDGLIVLNECFRVLIPGGVLRICTPSLDKYVDIFLNWNSKKGNRQFENGAQFLNYAIMGEGARNGSVIRYLSPSNPSSVDYKNKKINYFAAPQHDHRYIYSEQDLCGKLKSLSFSSVNIVGHGQSSYPELHNIESHSDLAELIVEAKK